MNTLTRLRAMVRESWQRHQRRQKLRRELADYRTPAERAELEAFLARHDTTIEELLRSVDEPAPSATSDEGDAEKLVVAVLDLSMLPRQRRG
jgi:hypothetical protein